MAITINLQPASPKYSHSDFVYSVSSDLVGPDILPANIKKQYSFVIDLYDGSTLLRRFRKQANPVGVGVFNLSDVINDYVEYDLAAVGSNLSYLGVLGVDTFSVRFGEEYLDGTTLKLYNGSDVEGNPAKAATDLVVYKGVDEYDTIGLSDASVVPPVLSSSELIKGRLHRNDKMSISTQSSGVLMHNTVTIPASVSSFTQTIQSVDYTFDVYDEKSILEETRFAWFNRKGGIDWFTADQEGNAGTSVDKSTFKHTNIQYGVTTPTNKAGNTFRSSETVYGVDYSSTYTKNTRWLTRAEANQLQGLFDSPNVYVQDGNNMRPVIITNSYEHYLPKRQQGLFQYSIEYRFTNDKRSI